MRAIWVVLWDVVLWYGMVVWCGVWWDGAAVLEEVLELLWVQKLRLLCSFW